MVELEKNYSLQELGQILHDTYNGADEKAASIHIFGIKYAKYIIDKYTPKQIVNEASINESYATEVSKGINIYKAIVSGKYGLSIADTKSSLNTKNLFDKSKASNFDTSFFQNKSNYLLRYATSLLAKPFVILTGNSGTGKTKIAMTLAKYFKFNILDYSKSMKEIFDYVKANDYDMRSIKIHSVSDNAIEIYNTKDKMVCISFGIIEEYVNRYLENDISSIADRSQMQEAGNYDGQSYSWDYTIKKIAEYVSEYRKKELKGIYRSNSLLIPVGSDWTDNTKILGFYNPMTKKYQSTIILDFLLLANENPNIPFFLILDEMNLSHVERYFSDFLSAMESGEPIPLYQKGNDCNETVIPEKIGFPQNLFITGTVNIDETTYMFSPKVLDRANVIEFKPENVMDIFMNDTNVEEIENAPDGMAESFLALAKEIGRTNTLDEKVSDADKAKEILEAIYGLLKETEFEFAYRTVKEIRHYINAAYKINPENKIEDIMDEQLLQKILPKAHGNRNQLNEVLSKLEDLCKKYGLEKSNFKIKYMQKKLLTNQFASFI